MPLTVQQRSHLQHLEIPGTWMTPSRSALRSASKAGASAGGLEGPRRTSPSLRVPQVCQFKLPAPTLCCCIDLPLAAADMTPAGRSELYARHMSARAISL